MRTKRSASKIDIVAFDRDDRPVLVVEVKNGEDRRPAGVSQLLEHLDRIGDPGCFGLLVTDRMIALFASDGSDGFRQVFTTAAESILSRYDDKFADRRNMGGGWAKHQYLKSLAGAWIRDFQIHWKYESPPGADHLRATDLPGRLNGGYVGYEVPLDGDLVRRD